MNFTPLNEELKRATDRFADTLVEMFQDVLKGVAGDITIDKRSAKAGPKAKAERQAKVAAPKATRGRKPGRPAKAAKPVVAAKPAKAAKPVAARPAKAAKPAKVAAKPAKAPKARGGRRTAEELEQFGKRVYDLLKQRPQGLRIEQINRELGTATSDLMRPIKKMLDEKRLSKKGDRRATVYFAG